MASRGMIITIASLVVVLALAMIFRPKQVALVMLGGAQRWLHDGYVRAYATIRLVGVGWLLFGIILVAFAIRDLRE